MLPVEDALARILAAFSPLPAELVPLDAGLGRVLAEDVAAARDQPPAAVSAMDGYAVRAADLAGGRASLRVVGEAPAGRPFAGEVGPGETVRIFTGSVLPAGADAVAIQENAIRDGDHVTIEGEVAPGRFVRDRGLDFRTGDVLLPAGRRSSARDIGLAAAMNRMWLKVHRRPRIALLATGDELALPGTPLAKDSIVSSNTPALAAMIRAWGGESVDLGIARDDPAALAEAARGIRGVDLVVTTGGASVGEHDLVRAVLGERGLALDFWKIAMRPGKPLIFGRLGDIPLLGLPGNPVSAGVCALVFLRPVLRVLQGLDAGSLEMPAVLGRALGPNDERQEYLRATGHRLPDGRLEVHPAERQDSSMFALFAKADCLVVRPAFAPAMEPGTPVRALQLCDSAVSI